MPIKTNNIYIDNQGRKGSFISLLIILHYQLGKESQSLTSYNVESGNVNT